MNEQGQCVKADYYHLNYLYTHGDGKSKKKRIYRDSIKIRNTTNITKPLKHTQI